MNEIVNKLLLIEDKSVPELHLRQPRFAFSLEERFLNILRGFKNI